LLRIARSIRARLLKYDCSIAEARHFPLGLGRLALFESYSGSIEPADELPHRGTHFVERPSELI
jgi:hypothetical protein